MFIRHRPATRILIAVLAAGLAGTSLAEAQDSPPADDFDPFAEGAFDTAVESGKTNAAEASLEWLGGLTLVTTASTSGPFPRDTVDPDYTSLATLGGKAWLKATKPDLGAFYVGYNVGHTLLASSSDPLAMAGLRAMDSDFAAPSFSLSELHLSFDLGKVVFIRIGNQLLSWSASSIWSPADFVNIRPADSLAAFDSRSGKPGVRLHIPFAEGGGNLFGFADFSETLATGSSGNLADTGVYALRADYTLSGWNLGIQGGFGPGTQPRIGATATGRLLVLDAWAEAAFDLPLAGHDYAWKTSAGGQFDFGTDKEAYVRGEYFHQSNGADDAVLSPLVRFTPLYRGKDYASLGLGTTKLLGSSELGGSLRGIANLSDLSSSWSATLDLRLPRLLPLSFIATVNAGREAREFTLASGAPSWKLELRSILEF